MTGKWMKNIETIGKKCMVPGGDQKVPDSKFNVINDAKDP